MQAITELTGHLISGLGQTALVVIMFSAVFRLTRKRRHSQLFLGLLFGIGAVASMVNPMEFVPGITIDTRSVMLALAAPFGGAVAAVVSMAMAGLVRVYIGGIGMPAGLLGIAIAGSVGLIHHSVFNGRTDTRALAVLGVMAAAGLLSLVVLPRELAISILVDTGPWLVVTNFIGIVAIGRVLSYEMRFQLNYATMKTEVDRDPLTGLYNRRAVAGIAERTKIGTGEGAERFAVVLLDIDYFKSVNDTYGHDAGDFVLEQVARIVSSSVRRTDYAIRYGGEEILLVLRGAGMNNAYGLAETIRTSVKTSEFTFDDHVIRVTVSAGIGETEGDEKTLAPAIRRADEALYAAKGNGRDRTERSGRLFGAAEDSSAD